MEIYTVFSIGSYILCNASAMTAGRIAVFVYWSIGTLRSAWVFSES